jgi:hypothetical protein
MPLFLRVSCSEFKQELRCSFPKSAAHFEFLQPFADFAVILQDLNSETNSHA